LIEKVSLKAKVILWQNASQQSMHWTLAGDSAAPAASIFLALRFFCSQAESTVRYGGRSTQTVSPLQQ